MLKSLVFDKPSLLWKQHTSLSQADHHNLQSQQRTLVRDAVLKRGEEVAVVMANERGDMHGDRMKEAELFDARRKREDEVRSELEERIPGDVERDEEVRKEAEKSGAASLEPQNLVDGMDRRGVCFDYGTIHRAEVTTIGQNEKTPGGEPISLTPPKLPTPLPPSRLSLLETPISRKRSKAFAYELYAVKGVALTTTGDL
jgi:hypothetical protein